jgi:cell division protein ZapA
MDKNDKEIVAVKVQVFGREYPVACPAGEEPALFQSAKFVDNEMHKVRQNGKVVGTDRIAVMVSLNLAHELLLSQTRGTGNTATSAAVNTAADEESRKRLHNMHERIDNALQQYEAYLPE